jgi:hypothetical protein
MAPVRITLLGDLAHSLKQNVVGKHTIVIVTSTMVEVCTVPYEETVPKLMEVDEGTKGTIQEQIFYNRRI